MHEKLLTIEAVIDSNRLGDEKAKGLNLALVSQHAGMFAVALGEMCGDDEQKEAFSALTRAIAKRIATNVPADVEGIHEAFAAAHALFPGTSLL